MKSERPSQRDEHGERFRPLKNDLRDVLAMSLLVVFGWCLLVGFDRAFALFAAIVGSP